MARRKFKLLKEMTSWERREKYRGSEAIPVLRKSDPRRDRNYVGLDVQAEVTRDAYGRCGYTSALPEPITGIDSASDPDQAGRDDVVQVKALIAQRKREGKPPCPITYPLGDRCFRAIEAINEFIFPVLEEGYPIHLLQEDVMLGVDKGWKNDMLRILERAQSYAESMGDKLTLAAGFKRDRKAAIGSTAFGYVFHPTNKKLIIPRHSPKCPNAPRLLDRNEAGHEQWDTSKAWQTDCADETLCPIRAQIRIFKLYDTESMVHGDIAKKLNAEGYRQVRLHTDRKTGETSVRSSIITKGLITSTLKNPIVLGYQRYEGKPTDEQVWPAVIEKDLWDRCQARRELNQKKWQAAPRADDQLFHVYRGLAYCRCSDSVEMGTTAQWWRNKVRRVHPKYLLTHRPNHGCMSGQLTLATCVESVIDETLAKDVLSMMAFPPSVIDFANEYVTYLEAVSTKGLQTRQELDDELGMIALLARRKAPGYRTPEEVEKHLAEVEAKIAAVPVVIPRPGKEDELFMRGFYQVWASTFLPEEDATPEEMKAARVRRRSLFRLLFDRVVLKRTLVDGGADEPVYRWEVDHFVLAPKYAALALAAYRGNRRELLQLSTPTLWAEFTKILPASRIRELTSLAA